MNGSTSRLYYTEPWLRRFETRVTDVVPAGSSLRVWLERTAFYPSSGGQPFDTGTLNDARVRDVIEGGDGRVEHVVEGTLEVGQPVVGEVDWPRRFDHMQQHTGQHILSAAFERLYKARTESFRLGAEFSTIDLAREVMPSEIASAEEEACRVVWEERPVTIRFVTDAEAAKLPLRKEPVRGGWLRLIEVEGYDLSACGGTHVSRTGEIGIVAVRGWEKFRGGTRVEFVCGRRALVSHRVWRDAATGAARLLSALPAELSAAVERLQQEGKDARRALKALAEKAAKLEAGALASRAVETAGVAVYVDALDGYDVNVLKLLASSFVAEPYRVAALFTTTTPTQFVVARSADVSRIDAAAIVAAVTKQFGGKGGGKPESAQGGGVVGTSAALIVAARDSITRMLTTSV
jgi:alanyl-tRNA synthetase